MVEREQEALGLLRRHFTRSFATVARQRLTLVTELGGSGPETAQRRGAEISPRCCCEAVASHVTGIVEARDWHIGPVNSASRRRRRAVATAESPALRAAETKARPNPREDRVISQTWFTIGPGPSIGHLRLAVIVWLRNVENASPQRDQNSMGAIVRAEFGHDSADVTFNGVLRDAELVRHYFVRVTGGNRV